MGKATGFLEYDRMEGPVRAGEIRTGDFYEFHGRLPLKEQQKQAARCMDCGIPFCQAGVMINGMASAAGYSAGSETVLCTFSCTVDDGFKGKAEVGLTNLEFLSCEDWTDHTGDYAVSKAVISVGQDAAQGRSADPGKASDSSGSSVSQSQSETAQTEDQAGDGASEANGSTQGNGTEDQSADEAKTETTDEAAGNAAAEIAEEENISSAIWLIALAAVLLIAVAIAVVFKKRKRK